jgi:hypothetical protein
MWMGTIVFVFACAYYLIKELEEVAIQSRFPRSFGSWWNDDTAWRNKHIWPSRLADSIGIKKYKKQFVYLFRVTFVFITDASHALQLLCFLILSAMMWIVVSPTAGVLFFLGLKAGGTIKELLKILGVKSIQ